MKKLLLFICLAYSFCVSAQLSNVPPTIATYTAFRLNPLPISMTFPAGYTFPDTVRAEVWQITGNEGSNIASITPTVTMSGHNITMQLTAAQVKKLPKTSRLYLIFDKEYILGANVVTSLSTGTPSTVPVSVALPSIGTVKINLIGDPSLAFAYGQNAITAAATATTKAGIATNAAATVSGAANKIGLISPSVTMTQLRAGKADTSKVITLIQNGRSRLFYYDSTDATTPDDSAMTIRYGAKRYKARYDGYVEFEWFNISTETDYTDETAKMMRAINYLKNKGGGTIRLNSKVYRGNPYWRGDWNISIEGTSPLSTLISANPNQFAIRVDNGYVPNGCFMRNFTVYGGDDKQRHGIYINCGSAYNFENIVFKSCGVGFLSNGTICNKYFGCTFISNYVGAIIGTFNAGYTSIADIAGQTVVVTPAFFDTQPAEQNFIGCNWFFNKMHVAVDYPSGMYIKCANIKLIGGQMEGGEVGVYVAQPIPLSEYPLVMENVWVENTIAANVTYKGVAIPPADLYMKGGKAVFKNIGLQVAYVLNGGLLEMDGGMVLKSGSDVFHVTDSAYPIKGSITAKSITGDDKFFPHYTETGLNTSGTRGFGFYNKPKTRKSRTFISNLLYSESHGRESVISGGLTGTESITKVSGGIMDGVCWNFALPSSNSGWLLPAVSSVTGKFYVSNFNIKSTGVAFDMSLKQYLGTGTFMDLAFKVPAEWKSISIVGRGTLTGSDQQYLYKSDGAAREFQMSGFQTLAFDTIEELYEFLKSDCFTTEYLGETFATSAPTSGAHPLGQKIYNSNPSSGSFTGWICVTSGTPGTWKGFGLIE